LSGQKTSFPCKRQGFCRHGWQFLTLPFERIVKNLANAPGIGLDLIETDE